MSITTTTSSPFVKARSVGLTEARWTGGFWSDRFDVCAKTMVRTMHRLMTNDERQRFQGNFEVASGDADGRHRGPKWNDGDFYKWLESAAAVYAITKDQDLDAEMDRAIAIVAKAQQPGGYIHTPVLISQRSQGELKRFADPMHFEMYNMGHLIAAACVHNRATGKTNFLKLARKTADFLDATFATPTTQQARHGICPSHLMALVELQRITNERRYLDLAIRLLNMRDLVTSGDDDNQDRIPFRQQTTAHGHAVRATYLYAGVADIYAETGDKSLIDPLQHIWRDLVSRKLYITGGCGALFDGASPDGAVDQTTITRVHQAFGRDYQLPQSTAHNETCAAIGNLLWNWRMFQITGESRFADLIELTLYNAVLAGVSLDGTSFFYANTLRQLNPMPVELRWPRQRQKTLGCFCCPPNVARTIAESANFAYATSERGVYAVLYGGSRLQTDRITLRQDTEYPWDGQIRITIEQAPAGEFSLMLRIPAWASGAAVATNGKPMAANPLPGTFHDIRRAWTRGDVIELDLPMPARLVEANPYVEEARNHVAVMRGPIVYCLESPDLPSHIRLMDVAIRRDLELRTTRDAQLLGGVSVVKCTGIAAPTGDWSGQLYRDVQLSPSPPRPIDLTLIPYYAWGNRGTSEMTVWIPATR